MKISTDDLENDSATEERFAGLQYRNPRPESGGDAVGDLPGPVSRGKRAVAASPSAVTTVDGSVLAAEPAARPTGGDLDSLPDLGLSAPWDEPVRAAGPAVPLADHPLLRGLLLELPPKGSHPPADWLDRWFEAARSILDLLYQQGQAAVPAQRRG